MAEDVIVVDEEKDPNNNCRRKNSFGFSYKLIIPWYKYPWPDPNSLMEGQKITNEAISSFLDENLLCQGAQNFANNPCSWTELLRDGPCRRIEWFQFLCTCYKTDDDDDNDDDCKRMPSRISSFIEDDLMTRYPFTTWLELEWMEYPEIIPNPKPQHDGIEMLC